MFAVPKGANSPYWVHKLIDYLLVPEVSAHLSLFTGHQSPVREAASHITDPLLVAMQPTDEELAAAHAYEDVGEFQSVYDEMWRAIKSAEPVAGLGQRGYTAAAMTTSAPDALVQLDALRERLKEAAGRLGWLRSYL